MCVAFVIVFFFFAVVDVDKEWTGSVWKLKRNREKQNCDKMLERAKIAYLCVTHTHRVCTRKRHASTHIKMCWINKWEKNADDPKNRLDKHTETPFGIGGVVSVSQCVVYRALVGRVQPYVASFVCCFIRSFVFLFLFFWSGETMIQNTFVVRTIQCFDRIQCMCCTFFVASFSSLRQSI